MNSKLGSVRDFAALQNDDGSGPDAAQTGGSFGALSPARGNARVSIDETAGIKRCETFARHTSRLFQIACGRHDGSTKAAGSHKIVPDCHLDQL